MICPEVERTVAATLREFYRDNNFPPDGGIDSSYAKIHLSRWLMVYIPNFRGRKRALLKHDIHHLVTGYSAGSLKGESEISAWEIASGCKGYWGAFLINTGGAMLGVMFNVRKVFRAFVKGRRSKNLYHAGVTTEEALKMKLRDLKALLATNHVDSKAVLSDFLCFVCFCLFGLVYSVLLTPAVPLIIAYSLYIRRRSGHVRD